MILPHLYTGGTVTFLHPYTPESWADHIEADASGSPVPRSHVQELVEVPRNASMEVRKDQLRAELGGNGRA